MNTNVVPVTGDVKIYQPFDWTDSNSNSNSNNYDDDYGRDNDETEHCENCGVNNNNQYLFQYTINASYQILCSTCFYHEARDLMPIEFRSKALDFDFQKFVYCFVFYNYKKEVYHVYKVNFQEAMYSSLHKIPKWCNKFYILLAYQGSRQGKISQAKLVDAKLADDKNDKDCQDCQDCQDRKGVKDYNWNQYYDDWKQHQILTKQQFLKRSKTSMTFDIFDPRISIGSNSQFKIENPIDAGHHQNIRQMTNYGDDTLSNYRLQIQCFRSSSEANEESKKLLQTRIRMAFRRLVLMSLVNVAKITDIHWADSSYFGVGDESVYGQWQDPDYRHKRLVLIKTTLYASPSIKLPKDLVELIASYDSVTKLVGIDILSESRAAELEMAKQEYIKAKQKYEASLETYDKIQEIRAAETRILVEELKNQDYLNRQLYWNPILDDFKKIKILAKC